MNRTSRRSKLLLITGFLTAGAVALAGCSFTRASSSASTKPSKVTLVVYSAQGYDHAMTAAFTKATGIPVKLDDNSTGPLQSGDPTGDSLYYPVLQGVSPLPALPSLSGVKTQTINPYTWGTKEATVNTWFDGTIVR